MKIKVKAFGAVRKFIPGYNAASGMELEFPSGLIVKELLVHLDIPLDKGVAVSMNGRIIGPDAEIEDGATVVLLNPLAGG